MGVRLALPTRELPPSPVARLIGMMALLDTKRGSDSLATPFHRFKFQTMRLIRWLPWALSLCIGAAAAQPEIHRIVTLADIEQRGLCLLSECPLQESLFERLTAKQLRQLRHSKQPWHQALAVLCDARGCPPEAMEPDHGNRFGIVQLSLQDLKGYLASPLPAVRAMALMRLDLHSPGARRAAEALLQDGAWVQPLALTVADHAYARLHRDIVLPRVGDYSNRKLELPPPIWTSALNLYKGVPGVSGLRNPNAAQDPKWHAALERFNGLGDVETQRRVLAGLWHQANLDQLRDALRHTDLNVRLVAFDALLQRVPPAGLPALAEEMQRQGGRQVTGGCIPMPYSVAVTVLAAMENMNQSRAATAFLNSLPDYRPADGRIEPFPNDPRAEVARMSPRRAAEHAPVLRRWIDEGLGEVDRLEASTSEQDKKKARIQAYYSLQLMRISADSLAPLNVPDDRIRLERVAKARSH